MADDVLRVMVVDDHPMWREGVARDLTEAGMRVVATASNGTEAITRFPAARPDVLVLDLQIPDPNGVAVTAEVGWSSLVTTVVEHLEVGDDDEPLRHRRGRYER